MWLKLSQVDGANNYPQQQMVRSRESKQDQVQKCDFLGGRWGKKIKKTEKKKKTRWACVIFVMRHVEEWMEKGPAYLMDILWALCSPRPCFEVAMEKRYVSL